MSNTKSVVDHGDVFEDSFVRLLVLIKLNLKSFLIGTIAVYSVFVAYVLIATPVYESLAIVKVGATENLQLQEPSPLEFPPNLMASLFARDSKNKDDEKAGYIREIKFEGRGNLQVMWIRAWADQPEKAQARLQESVDWIMSRHEKIYEEELGKRTAVRDRLTKGIAEVSREIKELDRQVKNSRDPILRIERAKLLQAQYDLERQLNEAQLKTAGTNLRPSEKLYGPSLPDRIVRPRRLMLLVLGFVISVFAGVALVIANDIVKRVKQES